MSDQFTSEQPYLPEVAAALAHAPDMAEKLGIKGDCEGNMATALISGGGGAKQKSLVLPMKLWGDRVIELFPKAAFR